MIPLVQIKKRGATAFELLRLFGAKITDLVENQ